MTSARFSVPRFTPSQVGRVLSSALGVEGLTLLRQVVVARIAGGDSLGGFLLLMVVLRFLQMATDLAGERFLITAKEHAVDRALGIVHAYNVLRAFVCALLLILILPLIPQVDGTAATILLVLACLMKGGVHQGYRLEYRHLDFKSMIAVEFVPAVLGTLALVPLILAFDPAFAIAAALLVQQCSETAISWLRSGRKPFRLSLHSKSWRALVRFGGPLLLSSWVLFFSLQGERLLFGVALPLADFTPLALALQLALLPALLMGRVMLTLGLPWMRVQRRERLARLVEGVRAPLVALAIVAAAVFALLANGFSALLFGPVGVVAEPVLGLIALIQMGRVVRAPASIAAQATGNTSIPLTANLVRAVALIGLGALLFLGAALEFALLPLLLGELMAWVHQDRALLCAIRLKRASSRSLSSRGPRPSGQEALS